MPSDLDPGAWVQEHGGASACARDVLAITGGRSDPRDIRAALVKLGAPADAFSLIWREVWQQTRR